MQLKFKKINLQKREGSNHPDISSKAEYLVIYDKKKIIGNFDKQWYGWNFNWFWSAIAGIQLDDRNISAVYEIIKEK